MFGLTESERTCNHYSQTQYIRLRYVFGTNRYNVNATNFRNLRIAPSVEIIGTRYPTMHGNIMAAKSYVCCGCGIS